MLLYLTRNSLSFSAVFNTYFFVFIFNLFFRLLLTLLSVFTSLTFGLPACIFVHSYIGLPLYRSFLFSSLYAFLWLFLDFFCILSFSGFLKFCFFFPTLHFLLYFFLTFVVHGLIFFFSLFTKNSKRLLIKLSKS